MTRPAEVLIFTQVTEFLRRKKLVSKSSYDSHLYSCKKKIASIIKVTPYSITEGMRADLGTSIGLYFINAIIRFFCEVVRKHKLRI